MVANIFTDRFDLKRFPSSTSSAKVDPNRIVMIGSCFARNFARWLRHHGLDTAESIYPWEIFYNPFSIAGEILRIFDARMRSPDPLVWTNDLLALRYSDPWRSWLVAESPTELERQNLALTNRAREYLSNPSALIMTLGLSEVWFHRERPELIFNQVPLLAAKQDASSFSSRFATPEEIYNALSPVITLVQKQFGTSTPIFLTLSPVPLKYTASNLSVHVANSLSKASIRVAIHRLCSTFLNTIYFPAYEIVQLLAVNSKGVFQPDGRHVAAFVVDEVVRHFLRQHSNKRLETSASPFWVPSVDELGKIVGRLFVDGKVEFNDGPNNSSST